MKSSYLFPVLTSLSAVCATQPNLQARDLAQTIWNDIKNAATCAACEGILLALKGVADFGETFFVDTLTEVCDISGQEDSDVCAGTLAREGPALTYTLDNLDVGSHTSTVLCANLFGLCQYPAVRPYTLTFPKPKPATTRPAPSGESPISVVHISDTHVDLSYETGSNWNCTKPICCRPYTSADAPGNTTTPCGPYGNTKCDSPLDLEESMIASVNSLSPKASFSIYTGDIPAHDIWIIDEAEVLQDFNETFDRVASMGVVWPAIGNHDAAPLNNLPISSVPSQYQQQWAYSALTYNFEKVSQSSAPSTTSQYGSYATVYSGQYGTDLKIISYNSIFYYVDNFLAYYEPMPYDPDGQLAWLISELQAAEDAGQRVWLIAHIPTATSDHFRDYSHYVDQIVQRYDATIAAQFYGHTHIDQFQISYSNYNDQTADTATGFGYITPSLTPTSGPPAYRVYDIDPKTFGVLDYTVYIANISDPSYQNGPVWTKYYSAKETYGSIVTPPVTDPTAELTPAFWHNVTVAFENDNSQFEAFYARQTRGWNVAACTGTCVTNTICGLRAADAQYNCVTPTPGFSFGKRSDEATQGSLDPFNLQHIEQCDDHDLFSLMRKITGSAVTSK